MTTTTPPVQQVDKTGAALPLEALPNVDSLVTEDDTPVDNIFSAKQQRLLVEPLYSSWGGGSARRKFLADSNVGVFYSVREPPLVPDAFLSLDVEAPQDLWPKRHRSYFIWEYGKPPDAVIEVVSNREGREAEEKLRLYARMAVAYYIIFDPLKQIQPELLRIFRLRDRQYVETAERWLPGAELGLTLWQGTYQDIEDLWLRWCDQEGNVILTGAERAEQERQRAEQAQQRADQLEAQLRALGIEPHR